MSIRRMILSALLILSIVFAAAQIFRVPDIFQYVVPAPDMSAPEVPEGETPVTVKKETPLAESLKSLQGQFAGMDGNDVPMAIKGYIENTSLGREGGQSVEAKVEGLNGASALLPRDVLTSGRYLYKEEIDKGDRVAVIDEQLAIALFRIGDPLGAKVMLGGESYDVVGVVRHSRSPEDKAPYSAYVPLLALDKAHTPCDVLVVWVRSQGGRGSYARMHSIFTLWNDQGTLYDLGKEQYRALLPLRFLLCFAGLLLLKALYGINKWLTKTLYDRQRERLHFEYGERLLPVWLLQGSGIALSWAAWLFAVYLIMREMIAPIYVFPEWVPQVLVEYRDIAATFWSNRETVSGLVELRTPEIVYLRFWHRVSLLFCAGLALVMVKPYGHLARRVLGKLNSCNR